MGTVVSNANHQNKKSACNTDESIDAKDIAEIIESNESDDVVENKDKSQHPLEKKDDATISNWSLSFIFNDDD